MYLAEKDITIRSLSEEADIPFETLKNFLYGKPQDCKLSTAVKLARALNVSVDELIGAETLRFDFKNNCGICRNLPDNSMYLINWLIRHQDYLYRDAQKTDRIISIVHVIKGDDGNLKSSGEFDNINISHLDNSIKSKVFVGIRIDCDRYMPVYSPYDTLLIANDRNPTFAENCLIIFGGNFYISKRIVENGVTKYRSIRDKRIMACENEIDELVGYIAHVIK
jgi:DNA-binding Xre family transcriptional regulator